MRRAALIILIVALCAVAAVPAPADARRAPVLIITGAGFGHGVGMSQYGARGLARHGFTFDRILRHYYRGTDLGTVPARTTVRVLLQSGVASASFSGASRLGDRMLDPEVAYQLVPGEAGFELRNGAGRKLGEVTAPVRASGPGPVTLRGVAINGIDFGRYRGALEFVPGGGRIDVVNRIALDDYVASVIGGEMPSTWPMEALKAQAIAARTYAITTNAGGQVFDQYPDTRSQVYGGATYEDARTRAATTATTRQVVTYRGEPAVTFFFSTSGGLTEEPRYSSLGSDSRPWLKSVPDPYEAGAPRHRWTVRMSPEAAGARLSGLVKGRFRGIRVIRRGRSPRIVEAEIVGTEGDTKVSGVTLRGRFGLPDTWAYFAVVG